MAAWGLARESPIPKYKILFNSIRNYAVQIFAVTVSLIYAFSWLNALHLQIGKELSSLSHPALWRSLLRPPPPPTVIFA